MNCRKPYLAPGRKAYGCGQCLPCRINKKRIWTHRILLESTLREDNCFATLTYAPENEPAGGTLRPEDVTKWLKRFRKEIEPIKIRYFIVGEYGDQTQRPHYHAIIFGYPRCDRGNTSPDRRGYCCPVCERVRRTWQHGHIYLGDVTSESASYVAGYVTKKLTSADDERLQGRHPEYARMSLRPGIGGDFIDEMASTILYHGLEAQKDVPNTLQHGKRKLPLGRYLTRRLRERVGRDPAAPKEVQEEAQATVQGLYQEAQETVSIGYRKGYVEARLLELSEGKYQQIKHRYRTLKKATKI